MKALTVGFLAVIGLVVLFTALGFLFAYPTMWLVNYLFTAATLTAIFGVAKISVWQAWALNILSGFLFKSTSTSNK